MNAPASPTVPLARTDGCLCTTVGLKVVMATSGIVLLGFVVAHMVGNLQIYLPRHGDEPWALDRYGVFLRELGHGGGLWVARGALLVASGSCLLRSRFRVDSAVLAANP